MTTNSSATEYQKQIDSLLAVSDNSSSSGDEEASDLIGSTISSKSKEETNRLDRWRLLEVEMKLQKKNYLMNLKEKNAIIEEKNQIIEERKCFINEKMRFIEEKNRFIIEKIQLIEEKNHMLEEKCLMMETKESEMRNVNESLKRKLEEATEQNKKLIEERDQLKQKQVVYQKHYESDLNEIKAQLDEQVKLVSEKDDQIKKLNKQLEQQTVSDYFSPNDYPKKVWLDYNNYFDKEPLGVQLSPLSPSAPFSPRFGVYLSSVKPGSRAEIAGLRVGERLLEVNGVVLRRASIESAKQIIQEKIKYRSNITMLVDVPKPETIDYV